MRIELPSGTPAELVHPVNKPASRGLVVIPDVLGVRPLFNELANNLSAENSWSVCVYELYPGQEDLDVAGRLEAASSLRDDRVLGDAVAAADSTGADAVGVLGFCMGGMYTLKSVATGRFDRHCSFYGMIRVPENWRSFSQGEPIEALSLGDASSVLSIIGSDDHWTPPSDVEALGATGATVVCYEGADHGFAHDPDRPTHRPDDAADAWLRAIDWFSS